MNSFFKGTTLGVRIAFGGFLVAAYGGLTAIVSAWIGIQWISILGFALVVAGVATGFIGIFWGWVELGRKLFKVQEPDGGIVARPSLVASLNERLRQKALPGLRIVFVGVVCAAVGSGALYMGDIGEVAWLHGIANVLVLLGFIVGAIGVVVTYAQLLTKE